jgi:hypothetical protein
MRFMVKEIKKKMHEKSLSIENERLSKLMYFILC